jgi:hypothetical protein
MYTPRIPKSEPVMPAPLQPIRIVPSTRLSAGWAPAPLADSKALRELLERATKAASTRRDPRHSFLDHVVSLAAQFHVCILFDARFTLGPDPEGS